MRGSSSPPATRKGRQDHYVAIIRKLKADKAALSTELSLLGLEKQKLLCMEQVLKTMAAQQSAIIGEVARLHHNLQRADGEQHAPGSPGFLQGVKASAVPGSHPTATDQYCIRILHTAQQADIDHARSLTAQGWCEYFSKTSAQVCLLLDIACRAATSHMQDQQLAHSTQQQQLQEQQQPQPQHPTGASSASNRPLWLGRSTPAGPSPVSTAQQAYQRLVDEFTLTALLAQIAGNNAAAYRAASLINLATGLPERETGFRDHWVQVARSLNLTQEQTVSLQVSYQQFNRYRAVLKGRQVDACKQVDHEICRQLERLGLNKQQQQEQQEGPGRSLPATAGGALGVGPAACRHHAVPVEGAPPSKNSISQLEGVMSGFMVSTQMLLVHLLNTLTYPQKARLMVSSYPYLPQPGSILEGINNMVLEDHHQQRQQQPQQQMQQSTEQRRSAPTQNSAPATKHDSAAGASTEIQLQQQPGSLLLSMHEAELQLRRADLQQQQVGFWERNQHLLVLAQQQLESENSRAASQQQKCSSGQSVKV